MRKPGKALLIASSYWSANAGVSHAASTMIASSGTLARGIDRGIGTPLPEAALVYTRRSALPTQAAETYDERIKKLLHRRLDQRRIPTDRIPRRRRSCRSRTYAVHGRAVKNNPEALEQFRNRPE